MHRAAPIVALICCLLMQEEAKAQSHHPHERGQPVTADGVCQGDLTAGRPLAARRSCVETYVRRAMDDERFRFIASSQLRQNTSASARRTPARRIFGAIVGATGGFFAGGYIGAWIEGDRCHCDDPGLKGALIGAPIGAVVGGVLGERYLF